jgi:hypothetical protein
MYFLECHWCSGATRVMLFDKHDMSVVTYAIEEEMVMLVPEMDIGRLMIFNTVLDGLFGLGNGHLRAFKTIPLIKNTPRLCSELFVDVFSIPRSLLKIIL